MDKNLIYVGGGLFAVWLLMKSQKPTASQAQTMPGTAPSSNNLLNMLNPSNTANAGTYTDATGHQVTVQPTAAQNAGLTNPSYQLSQSELNAYYNNYLDLQQGLASDGWVQKYGSLNAALQQHWTQNGVTDHRTFLPLASRSTTPFVAPPHDDSGGWLSSALKIATTVVALAGVNNSKLTRGDKDLLIAGTLVAKQLLPLFPVTEKTRAMDNKMDSVIIQIT